MTILLHQFTQLLNESFATFLKNPKSIRLPASSYSVGIPFHRSYLLVFCCENTFVTKEVNSMHYFQAFNNSINQFFELHELLKHRFSTRESNRNQRPLTYDKTNQSTMSFYSNIDTTCSQPLMLFYLYNRLQYNSFAEIK